jgi:hypothetical protein
MALRINGWGVQLERWRQGRRFRPRVVHHTPLEEREGLDERGPELWGVQLDSFDDLDVVMVALGTYFGENGSPQTVALETLPYWVPIGNYPKEIDYFASLACEINRHFPASSFYGKSVDLLPLVNTEEWEGLRVAELVQDVRSKKRSYAGLCSDASFVSGSIDYHSKHAQPHPKLPSVLGGYLAYGSVLSSTLEALDRGVSDRAVLAAQRKYARRIEAQMVSAIDDKNPDVVIVSHMQAERLSRKLDRPYVSFVK